MELRDYKVQLYLSGEPNRKSEHMSEPAVPHIFMHHNRNNKHNHGNDGSYQNCHCTDQKGYFMEIMSQQRCYSRPSICGCGYVLFMYLFAEYVYLLQT